jgi:hypothetical protein
LRPAEGSVGDDLAGISYHTLEKRDMLEDLKLRLAEIRKALDEMRGYL